MKEFIPRIGTFFYLMGTGCIILFIASDAHAAISADRTDYNLLFLSILFLAFGFFFRKRAAPPEAADRFRMIRRYRENKKKKQEEKAKAGQQKK